MNKFVHEVKNFLDKPETELIKNSVFSLENCWKPLTEYQRFSNIKQFATDKEKLLHVLGDAIYVLKDGDRSEIDSNLRDKLTKEFDWLYLKLFDTIKEVFDVDKVELDTTLTVPGFHVFGKYQIDNAEYGFHEDSSILHYYPSITPTDIRSFAVLIQSPSTHPYLEIDSDTGFDKVFYEYGSLYFWHGLVLHRIGPFSLQEGEYRITFQGHFYVDPDTQVVKVYF